LITLREDGLGNAYPVAVCDTCNILISGNNTGLAVWKIDEAEKVKFVHKRVVNPDCDDDDYDRSMEIEEFVDLLVKNTKSHDYD
jgi:hypothetical protein